MKNFFVGLAIGVACIVPGVSGGTLCVVMGIYDRLIDSIVNFFKNVKENIKFLFPLLAGFLISIIIFSKILNYLLMYFEYPVKYTFVGILIGSIPAFYSSIENKENRKNKINYLITFITILISIILFVLQKYLVVYSIGDKINIGMVPYLGIILAGFLYACGKIIPGVSGTALLMLIGMYDYVIEFLANITDISSWNVNVIIPFIISFGLGCLILIKLLDYFFKKHYRISYSVILGFVISSIIYVFPGFYGNYMFVSIILLVISIYLTLLFSNKKAIS